MSEPEISRRCSACGATARSYALFCPQCGQPIPKSEASEQTSSDKTLPKEERELAKTIPLEKVGSEHPAPQTAAAPSASPLERGRTSVRAAAEGLKGVEENVRERVERIRKVSHVVIDQAAYDPSLRFLLVAGGFFLLFLVLVILSKLIG